MGGPWNLFKFQPHHLYFFLGFFSDSRHLTQTQFFNWLQISKTHWPATTPAVVIQKIGYFSSASFFPLLHHCQSRNLWFSQLWRQRYNFHLQYFLYRHLVSPPVHLFALMIIFSNQLTSIATIFILLIRKNTFGVPIFCLPFLKKILLWKNLAPGSSFLK